MDLKILVVVISIYVTCSKGDFYRKFMTLNDSDYSLLFTPVSNPPSMTLGSLAQCAAYASYALLQPNIAMRASAFTYLGKTCTLGRTPPYDDQVLAKATVTDGSDGVHAVVGMKPLAKNVLNDPGLVAYFLFNEAVQEFSYTPGLANFSKNLALVPGPWTLPIASFTLPSVIQMLESHLAAPGFPSILYRHNPKIYMTMSVMLWYSPPAASGGSHDPMFGVWHESSAATNYLILTLSVMYFGSDACAGESHPTSFPAIPVSTWAYIGFTFDNGVTTLYINGTATANYTFNICGSSFWLNVTDMEIGWSNGAMLGSIASLEVYDVALTQAQINEAMIKSTTSRALKIT